MDGVESEGDSAKEKEGVAASKRRRRKGWGLQREGLRETMSEGILRCNIPKVHVTRISLLGLNVLS